MYIRRCEGRTKGGWCHRVQKAIRRRCQCLCGLRHLALHQRPPPHGRGKSSTACQGTCCLCQRHALSDFHVKLHRYSCGKRVQIPLVQGSNRLPLSWLPFSPGSPCPGIRHACGPWAHLFVDRRNLAFVSSSAVRSTATRIWKKDMEMEMERRPLALQRLCDIQMLLLYA